MRTNYDWLSNLKPEQLALILDQAQDIGTEEDGRMDPVQWLIWLQDEADPMFFYNKSIDIFL